MVVGVLEEEWDEFRSDVSGCGDDEDGFHDESWRMVNPILVCFYMICWRYEVELIVELI